jgi:hypothetical protein
MTAVLCGNLRAEIVRSAGIRLQRFTSSPPSERAQSPSGWDSNCAMVVPSGVPQPLTAS